MIRFNERAGSAASTRPIPDGVFFSAGREVEAGCVPVTHSSQMTHLSSSPPHGFCFTTRLFSQSPSFTGGDEWRAVISGGVDEQCSLERWGKTT